VAEVNYFKILYFKFNIKEKKNFQVSLTNFNGYHRFVMDTSPKPQFITGKYKWIGFGVASEVLTISSTDHNFIYGPNATYYIGVQGYTTGTYKSTEFQLSFKVEGSTEILSEGIPQFSETTNQNYQFFEYQLSSENDLWLDVQSDSWGDSPYLCISTEHKKPTVAAKQCQWKVEKSQTGFGSITINKTETNWKKSSYYIGVRFYFILFLLLVDFQMQINKNIFFQSLEQHV
jgi:hypothetical protein